MCGFSSSSDGRARRVAVAVLVAVLALLTGGVSAQIMYPPATPYSFTLDGDDATTQSIDTGNTLLIAGGNGVSTDVAATDTITIDLDGALWITNTAGVDCTGASDSTSGVSTALAAAVAAGKALLVPSGCKLLIASPGAGATNFTLADGTTIVGQDTTAGFKLAGRTCTAGNFGTSSAIGAPCASDTGATDGCGTGGTCAIDGGLAGVYAPTAASSYQLFTTSAPSAGTGKGITLAKLSVFEQGDTGFNVCVNGTNAGRACKVTADCAGTGATCGNLACSGNGLVGATSTPCCTGTGTGSCGPPGSAHGAGQVNILDGSNAQRLNVDRLYVWQHRLGDYEIRTSASTTTQARINDFQNDLTIYAYGTNQTTPPVRVEQAVHIQGCAALTNSRVTGGLGIGLDLGEVSTPGSTCWPSITSNVLYGSSRLVGTVPGNAVSIGARVIGPSSITANHITGGLTGLYLWKGLDNFLTNNVIVNYPDNWAGVAPAMVAESTGSKIMSNYIVGGVGVTGFTGKNYAINWGGLDLWQYCTADKTPFACCTGGGGTGTGCTGSGQPFACCTGSGTGNCWNASTCPGAGGTGHQQLQANTIGSFTHTGIHVTNVGRRCSGGTRYAQPCTTSDTNATTGCPVAGACDYGLATTSESTISNNWGSVTVGGLLDVSDLATSGQGCTSASTPWACCTGSGTGTCGMPWGSNANGNAAPGAGSASTVVANNTATALLKSPTTFHPNIYKGSYIGNVTSATFATAYPNWDWTYGNIIGNSPPITQTAAQLAVGSAVDGNVTVCSDCDEFGRSGGSGAAMTRLNGAWVAATTDWSYSAVKEFSISKNLNIGSNMSLQVYGIDAPVNTAVSAGGTPTDVTDSSGSYIAYATSTSTDSEAGWISSRFNLTRPDQTPVFMSVIKTGASIANTRLWAGMASATPMASDTPTVTLAGIRYSTGASDTTFKCVTCNGTNCQVQDTGVTVVLGTRYLLKTSCAADRCECFVNNIARVTNAAASACVRSGFPSACCTAAATGATCYFPASTTNLGYVSMLRTLTTSARTLNQSRIDMVVR